jgi:addiction module HigA family antidote
MQTTLIRHPGITLKEAIEKRQLSQRAVAKALGMSQPALSNMLKGQIRISPKVALRIEQHIGLSAESLLYAQTAFDLAAARAGAARPNRTPATPELEATTDG